MDIRHIWQEHRSEPGSAVTAWIVAVAMLVMMQGAVLLADHQVCTAPEPTRSAKSGLDGAPAMADDLAIVASGERYYRCFERKSEARNGSFVIGLACVWPVSTGSGS